jgi:ferredoxin-NADP reductase
MRTIPTITLLAAIAVFAWAMGSSAQTAEEHASHHPGAAAPSGGGMAAMPAGAAGSGLGPPAGVGPPGGMPDMAKMMEGMGKTPQKEIFPSMMGMPEVTPEMRAALEARARERLGTGMELISAGVDQLSREAGGTNYAAMQEATAKMREGLARFDSGIAARRALAEGTPPKKVATRWFKDQMNLLPPQGVDASGSGSGISALHLLTMALLIVFAVAMLAMYYFKMRRAAALFGRLDADSTSSSPGSLPPQDGGGKPSPPPGDKGPTSGGSPPTTAPVAEVPPSRSPTDASAQFNKSITAQGPASTPQPPLTSKWRGQLSIETITRETPNIKTFRLGSPGGGPLSFIFLPGQFINVAFSVGGARMNRSYSISSSPNERNYLELSVKREERGAVSRHIVDLLKAGQEIEASGPVGKLTFTGSEADSIVLISAGIGITPMMSVARYLSEQSWPGDIFFIFTCRTPADYIFEKPLAALASRNPKLHVVVSMTKPGPDWKGPCGRITKELLAQSVPNIASRRIHLCGPASMMEATKSQLSELGVAMEHVKTEAFGAVKPPLAGPNDSAKTKIEATGPVVTFSKSNKSARIGIDQTGEQAALATGPGQTILEFSEELAIGIENSCRVGTCGVCKVKMTSGEVDMEVDDALDEDDKANGIILACQAKPKTPITVEA